MSVWSGVHAPEAHLVSTSFLLALKMLESKKSVCNCVINVHVQVLN